MKYLYISTKVENVMNAAVLYYDTITKYRDFKCREGRGGIGSCLQGTFDGEEYFNKFILKHDGQPLFGDKSRRVKLDSCGDSTPRYAIYQLQNTRLTYYVSMTLPFPLIPRYLFALLLIILQKIGTWSNVNGTGGLELSKATNVSVTNSLREPIPLTKRLKDDGGTKCKPECKDTWKEVFLQNVI